MRILYLDSSIDFSGGQKSLLALLSRLDRAKFHPIVAVDKKAEKMKSALKMINIEFIPINYCNSKYFAFLLLPFVAMRLFFLIHRADCRILHCNTFKVGLICSLISGFIPPHVVFRSRLGIVVNSHGFVDKIIYQRCDLILANSNYVRNTFLERFGDNGKVRVVYNPLFGDYSLDGVAVEKLKRRYFSEGSLFYFGCIGRIEEFKRQHEIVEAVRILSRGRTDFKVLFLGNLSLSGGQKYKENLEGLIEKYRLGSFFEFTGFIGNIYEATSLLNCVLLCTEGEPLSRGVFESQFLRTPVIASNSGGNLELIEHEKTGLLYELRNPEDLANKMERIMDSPDLRKSISSEGHSFVLTVFSPEETIQKEEQIYIRLVDGA